MSDGNYSFFEKGVFTLDVFPSTFNISATSQVSGVISLKLLGDLENYTFLEKSGCTKSENPWLHLPAQMESWIITDESFGPIDLTV